MTERTPERRRGRAGNGVSETTAGARGAPSRGARGAPSRGGAPALSAAALAATADAIRACQRPDGMIVWFDGGHADVWNHTEAAMALTVAAACAGADHSAAEAAFEWLARSQLPDGSWHSYYLADRVEDPQIDANCCAYPAVGVWHRFVAGGDRAFAESMWPTVARALDFVVGLRRDDGHIPWAVRADATPWSYSLLTGSCSIAMSLDCGLALAAELGHERPEWELTALGLRQLIAQQPETFEPKHRWAMDWYYPVLCGAVSGAEALLHLAAGADRFVRGGDGAGSSAGVRCVSDQEWVTAAETCECALAYLRAGDPATARRLFRTTDALRDVDGAYFTGRVLPQGVTFPAGERSSYTAAAVLLAADALDSLTPAARVLTSAGAPADGAADVPAPAGTAPAGARRSAVTAVAAAMTVPAALAGSRRRRTR